MTVDAVRDEKAKELWNEAYLNGADNLWGDPPAPYAAVAARRFAERGAFIVMDLPCGDGRNLPPLAAGAPVLIGGDTSINAMAIAKKVTTRAGVADKTVFLEIDAYATKLPDASVDGIFCWDFLGHLSDPAAAMRELYRILRPGGSLVANMWTPQDCQVTDPNNTEIAPKEFIDHFDLYCRFYDREDLDELLESVDLETERVDLERWTEPPHVGYRDYVHDHECLVFTVRKPA